jgi:hypothetical protein
MLFLLFIYQLIIHENNLMEIFLSEPEGQQCYKRIKGNLIMLNDELIVLVSRAGFEPATL